MAPLLARGRSQSGNDSDPLYLSVIDLGGRVVLEYFLVVGLALLVDLSRGDRLVFRAWSSFAVQSAGALLLGTIVARRTLTSWKWAEGRFVPANVAAASFVIGAALAVGTLAGGFIPDAVNARRRATEMFVRAIVALIPALMAVYLVLRSAARNRPVAPANPLDGPLTGDARDAALRALEMLERGDQALTGFQQRIGLGRGVTADDAERLWEALDGPGIVALLRQMPPEHAVTKALWNAGVAQTDAAYLMALSRGAHDAVGHTEESARGFVEEVAARRGEPGGSAEELAGLSRSIALVQRDVAASLLHVSRFNTPARDSVP
jgi:hypothetical protein